MERYGKHWSKIVPLLGDKRTEHMIKNRFHTLISKQRMYRNEKDGSLARKLLRLMKCKRKADPFTEDEGQYEIDSVELKQPVKNKPPISSLSHHQDEESSVPVKMEVN